MEEDGKCKERLKSCGKRMDSQADDIKELFRSKASKSILILFFAVLLGSYAYTKGVADDVAEIVTKTDMVTYQETIIKAIEAIK